jgi:tetratricopeptide (TPR) repeat protein
VLALVPSTVPIHPRRDFEEAIRISREIGSLDGETWALWSVGLLRIVHGQYGQALEAAHNGLQIATQIEHREGMAASRSVLGVLYTELLTPERARQHLEAALTLAEELHNRVLILWATGALAAAYCLLDDLAQAQTCLETVLSAETPMDTLYKRYCWARRAELAWCQGDPALALDIVGRLIASAAGMSPGRVITYLWWLKGEALAAMGQTEQAHTMLHEAVENAHATGERFLLWRLHASLGWLCLAVGRHSEADKELSTARELIEELADAVPDGELRDNFLQRAHERLRASP